jgi:hypothetical protein
LTPNFLGNGFWGQSWGVVASENRRQVFAGLGNSISRQEHTGT